MHKRENDILTFLMLGPILDHIFGPKKDILLCPVFFFPQRYVQCRLWSCTIPAQWRLKHFINISWYNSIPVLKNGNRNTVFYFAPNGSQFIFLKCDGSIWDLGGKFRLKRIHLLWSFWSLSFKFFFKIGNHEKHS